MHPASSYDKSRSSNRLSMMVRYDEPSSSLRSFAGRSDLSLFLAEYRTHQKILPMERDQSQQAIPRNSRLRGNVIEAAVKSIQVAADVSDHVEE